MGGGQPFYIQQQAPQHPQAMMMHAQSAAQLAAANAPPGSMVVVQHPDGTIE